MTASAGPAVARDINTAAVLEVLQSDGPLSQAELVRRTGLARPTVAAIARTLLHHGVAEAAGPDPRSTTGRPGILIAFRPACAVAAVVRLLPHGIDARLVDAGGRTHGTVTVANPEVAATTLPLVAALLRDLADEQRLDRPTSVSLLLAGRLDPVTQCVVGSALDPGPVPLDDVEAALSAPVTVLNPTASAALGVARTGLHRDALVVFVDHGVGVGVVSGGRVLQGATGAVGEVGHSRVTDSDRRCECGRIGCLETVTAGWYIRSRAAELLGGDAAGVATAGATVAQLHDLHHPGVDALLDEAAERLGLATSWLVNTLNPASVLLGGTPFVAGAHRFRDVFAGAVRAHSLPSHTEGLLIDLADPTADLDGATAAALDRLTVLGGVPVRRPTGATARVPQA